MDKIKILHINIFTLTSFNFVLKITARSPCELPKFTHIMSSHKVASVYQLHNKGLNVAETLVTGPHISAENL